MKNKFITVQVGRWCDVSDRMLGFESFCRLISIFAEISERITVPVAGKAVQNYELKTRANVVITQNTWYSIVTIQTSRRGVNRQDDTVRTVYVTMMLGDDTDIIYTR